MNDLSDIQKKLNDPEICPEMFYRRNSLSYPLNCYVNQITGLLISEDFDTIPVVIGRIYSFFQKSVRKESVPDKYRSLVVIYIDLVKSKLEQENLLSDIGKSHLKRAELKQKK